MFRRNRTFLLSAFFPIVFLKNPIFLTKFSKLTKVIFDRWSISPPKTDRLLVRNPLKSEHRICDTWETLYPFFCFRTLHFLKGSLLPYPAISESSVSCKSQKPGFRCDTGVATVGARAGGAQVPSSPIDLTLTPTPSSTPTFSDWNAFFKTRLQCYTCGEFKFVQQFSRSQLKRHKSGRRCKVVSSTVAVSK